MFLHRASGNCMLCNVGRGGPLVKHFLAGKPPVTAPTRRKSFPANSQTFGFARCGIGAAHHSSTNATTTAGRTTELCDSSSRPRNQRCWMDDSRKRVRIRKRIVKKLTNPALRDQTDLREECPKATTDRRRGCCEETTVQVSSARTLLALGFLTHTGLQLLLTL